MSGKSFPRLTVSATLYESSLRALGISPPKLGRSGSRWIPFGVLTLGIVLLFWTAAHTYFGIDDFFWLYDGSHLMSSVSSWMLAFSSSNGSGQYRPLTENVFWWISWRIFGFDPFGYHLVNLIVFIVTSCVLYKVFHVVYRNRSLALLAASLFAFSATHYTALAWASGMAGLGALLFAALFLLNITRNRNTHALVFFILCLLSNETTIILPFLALAYIVIGEHVAFPTAVRRTGLLWMILLGYLIFRFAIAGLPLASSGPFAVVLSLPGWLFLIRSSLAHILGLSPTLRNVLGGASALWRLAATAFLVIWILCLGVLGLFLANNFLNRRATLPRETHLFWVGVLWFVFGMAPILPFSRDFSNYNLAIPLIGVSLCITSLVQITMQYGWQTRIMSLCLIIAYFAVNWIGIYGPGGLNAVDGIRVLARADRVATYAISTVASASRGPNIIDVTGSPTTSKAVFQSPWLMDLLDPHGTMYFGTHFRSANLVLHLSGTYMITIVRLSGGAG